LRSNPASNPSSVRREADGMGSRRPRKEVHHDPRDTALVVGAGIGGIRAALDLAESGHRVVLIESAPYVGGLLSQLERQFPTNRCGMCRMLPVVERDAASEFCLRRGLFHENIELYLSTRALLRGVWALRRGVPGGGAR